MNKEAMAIAVDLVVDASADTLCEEIGLDHEHIYKEKPSLCPTCNCSRFRAYEILGSVSKPIIWECKKCDARFGKYPLEKMEKLLEAVSGLWTNPEDWSKVPKNEYN